MRALKALVIGMGILIVAGFAVLVVGLIQRVGVGGDGDGGVAGSTPRAPIAGMKSPAVSGDFGDVRVSLPAGAVVAGVSTDAGRLVVHVRLAGGASRVLVIDLATGRRLGAIDLGR